MRWRARLGAVGIGTAMLLGALAPAAGASIGSITGIGVDPSLTDASVQNFAVTYDGCSAAANPNCSWDASAWLVPPPATSCPANGSWLLMYESHPPGLPGWPLPNGLVWRAHSSGDGTVQSGPLQLDLAGVNDQYLCLYATEPAPISTAPPLAYQPTIPDPSTLLAAQLLHVDPSPNETTQLGSPAPPLTCRKPQVNRHGRCVRKKIRRHRHPR